MTSQDSLESNVDPSTSAAPAVAALVDVPELTDLSVRSALDFAVGIAAAGQKIRPPLAFPQGLKPLLKFNRLDRTSLRAARRAVAGDSGFRERLGLAATSEMVDEIGLLWLQRPDGWIDQALALQARAKADADEASADAALRKAERRREAAEQAASRAQAELLGHHDAIAREQLRRERAEEMATTARREAAAAKAEVTRLTTELAQLRESVAAEAGRTAAARDTISDLTEQLRAAERMRDDALATRASSAPSPTDLADTSRPSSNTDAANALRNASKATRELAAALAAASDALSDSAPVLQSTGFRRSGHDRSPKRKPIAIPGGVYGDSMAAVDHLLRTPRARIIVDGYNLAKLAWPGRELVEQRECCIALLEDLARRTAADVHVIFDGADVVGASAGRRLVRVQFSPAGVIADDVIRAEVAALPASTPVVVVTGDQAIVNDVRLAGANTLSSDLLLQAARITAPGTRRR